MRKTLPESIYDFPAIEGWLSDYARQGLEVEKLSGNYVSFREGVSEERRFRLKPCMDRTAKPDEELLQAYEEAGWELAASMERPKLYLWCSIRPDPAEIHTEPGTEALALNWVAKQLKQELWVFGICDFLVLAILALGAIRVGVLLALLCFGDSDQRFRLPEDPLPVVSASALDVRMMMAAENCTGNP